MKQEDHIEEFKKLAMQTERLFIEFKELSKKKPNDVLNRFKLNFVNDILKRANKIIDARNKPFEHFDEFEEEALPTNSDVVIVLSQYRACLKKFFTEDIERDSHGDRVWLVKGKPSGISAPGYYQDLL